MMCLDPITYVSSPDLPSQHGHEARSLQSCQVLCAMAKHPDLPFDLSSSSLDIHK